jgi:hypothetical protein
MRVFTVLIPCSQGQYRRRLWEDTWGPAGSDLAERELGERRWADESQLAFLPQSHEQGKSLRDGLLIPRGLRQGVGETRTRLAFE